MRLPANDALAIAVREAITNGDLSALESLLHEHDALATAVIGNERSMLHIATDWPGHFPNGPATVRMLVAHGADVHAHFTGFHRETPLHWAASSNDVAVLDALLDAGADIEIDGSLFDNGTALADAVAFGQWDAARRLVERGAHANLWQAAALGLMDRLDVQSATRDEITNAFWSACHGGQLEAAKFLLERGADIHWVGHDKLTPLGAAKRSNAHAVVEWLRAQSDT